MNEKYWYARSLSGSRGVVSWEGYAVFLSILIFATALVLGGAKSIIDGNPVVATMGLVLGAAALVGFMIFASSKTDPDKPLEQYKKERERAQN